MILSVAFLVAPDSVASVMAQSPLLTSLIESIAGDLDEPAVAPEGGLEPAAVDAGDDVVPSGSGSAPP